MRTLPLLLILTSLHAAAAEVELKVTTKSGEPAEFVVVTLTPSSAWAPRPPPPDVTIVQRDIRFEPYVTAVPAGTNVRFVNRDSYDHHVRSLPGGPLGAVAPVKQFEFRLPAIKRGQAEATVEQRFELPGTVVLGCHLHGSMRGHLHVTSSPWVAVTDASGRARLEGLPDGQANLVLWHPDQLVAQPAVQVQLATEAKLEARLNFSPRQRRVPSGAPANEYTTQ